MTREVARLGERMGRMTKLSRVCLVVCLFGGAAAADGPASPSEVARVWVYPRNGAAVEEGASLRVIPDLTRVAPPDGWEEFVAQNRTGDIVVRAGSMHEEPDNSYRWSFKVLRWPSRNQLGPVRVSRCAGWQYWAALTEDGSRLAYEYPSGQVVVEEVPTGRRLCAFATPPYRLGYPLQSVKGHWVGANYLWVNCTGWRQDDAFAVGYLLDVRSGKPVLRVESVDASATDSHRLAVLTSSRAEPTAPALPLQSVTLFELHGGGVSRKLLWTGRGSPYAGQPEAPSRGVTDVALVANLLLLAEWQAPEQGSGPVTVIRAIRCDDCTEAWSQSYHANQIRFVKADLGGGFALWQVSLGNPHWADLWCMEVTTSSLDVTGRVEDSLATAYALY
jgi:hypothetical protein